VPFSGPRNPTCRAGPPGEHKLKLIDVARDTCIHGGTPKQLYCKAIKRIELDVLDKPRQHFEVD